MTDLATAIEVYALAAEKVNEAAQGAISDLTWEDAIELLSTLRTALTDHIGPVESSLVRHVYLTGPHAKVEVDGIGMVDIHRTTDRKRWDQRSAAYAVLDARMSERGDGEIPDPAEVVEWLLEAGNFGYFRAGALRGIGLRASDFCEESIGKPAVTITRPGK